ncbi:MAG TPA: hypothetical protein VK157_01355 [Phycisphaerales bacterium]|nr:hypothetical protein [Phycisphaerales bacterium]
MFEIQINRLPGGDASRRTTLARITLTNTGEGLGGVKIYDIRIAEADDRIREELRCNEARTHREVGEGIVALVRRSLDRLAVEE